MKKVFIIIILGISIATAAFAGINTARVTGGEVQGVASGDLTIFKGIPFAAPPVGDLRWKAPAPVQTWKGVKQADAFADACMQPANSQGNTAPVNEDCLYLNVWTPAKSAADKVPVLVWIHGGGFVGGSTSIPMYDGTGFAEKGVVFVSLAYRLGPYGFLAHPQLSRESGHGSGTYGILDLVQGLQWVKQNIAAFGGDPDNVTIFGHSAGGAAVSFLAASPLAKGLFDRVICMSGGSFTPLQRADTGGFGLGVPALELAESGGEALFNKLGVADLDAARALDAAAIEAAAAGMRFRPVADGYVITSDLYTMYMNGQFNDTPLLVGNTSDETLSFGAGQPLTPAAFMEQITSQYGTHADAIMNAYPHASEADATRAARHVRNDSSFGWNSWAWARLQSGHGKGRVYEYYYNHHAPEAEGAGHGSDVAYAFQTLGSRRGAPQPADLKLSDMISSYWVNFTMTGDPNAAGLPEWPAYSTAKQQVMVFDAASSARPLPTLDKLKVFDAWFEDLRASGQ